MLIVSSDYRSILEAAISKLPFAPLISDEAVHALKIAAEASAAFGTLARNVSAVLEEQGFVQIRGLPVEAAQKFFPALGGLIGLPFIDPAEGNVVINAHVRPSQELMGNQLRHLPLHTDYSMMETPPRLTLSLCVAPDPSPGWGALQIADIEAMIFGVENEAGIDRLFQVKLPFAGRNAQSGLDLIESPILSKSKDTGNLVARYHRSRIRQGFRVLERNPSQEEVATMIAFERLASERVETLHPEAGDITVIDNHRTLHARTRCSVNINSDGSARGRQMQFLFAF